MLASKLKYTVLYLTLESYEKQPILKSQVLPLLNAITSLSKDLNTEIQFILTTKDVDTVKIDPTYPITHVKISNGKFLLGPVLLFFKLFKLGKSCDLIHVRSYLPMITALLLKLFYRKGIIFDLRGVFPEEIALRKRSKFWFVFFKKAEAIFCKYADVLVVVSKKFMQHIQTIYPKQHAKLVVIPTFAKPAPPPDTAIDNIISLKKEYFKDAHVTIFAYSGAFEKWQCVNEVFDFFEEISKLYSKYRFAIFSHHAELFKSLAQSRKINMDLYYINYIENKSLAQYISQCDAGVLFRKNTLINRVAAPIKFTDYLTSGLLVIISADIGDSSDLVQKFDLGYITENLKQESIQKLAVTVHTDLKIKTQKIHERIKKALDEIDISKAAEKYLTLYLKQINKVQE